MIKTRKGIYCFSSRKQAAAWAKANDWPTDRIIDCELGYELGYAIQAGPSGNYAGPGIAPQLWMGDRKESCMENLKNPIQPLCFDKHGTLRFRENKIVRFMLDAGGRGEKFNLNTLACMDFTDDDREQLAQLIGYSFDGWSDLSYVSDETWKRAARAKPRKKS